MKAAAENLRAATNAATQNALRKKLVHRLENAARQAAVAATQTVAAANAAEPYNSNKASQNQLMTHSKVLFFLLQKMLLMSLAFFKSTFRCFSY